MHKQGRRVEQVGERGVEVLRVLQEGSAGGGGGGGVPHPEAGRLKMMQRRIIVGMERVDKVDVV